MAKKLKLIFIPCQENNYRPKFLESHFLLYYLVILLILKLLVVPFFFYFPKTAFFAEIVKSALINLVNEERQTIGLGPLKESTQLNTAAELKAKDIIEKDYFSHYSPEGISPWYWFKKAGYNYEVAGENLAIGFLDSEEVHQAWIASASHRKNLLNPRFDEIGIAVLKGDFQGNETTLVVQLFAAPKSEVVSAAKKEPEVFAKAPESEIKPQEEIVEAEAEREEFVAGEILSPPQPENKNGKGSSEAKALLPPKNNFGFNFALFLTHNYQKFLQIIIYISLVFIIAALLVNIFVKFDIQHGDLILKALGFIVLLIIFLWLDKATIIQLIPHQLKIY